MRQRHYRMGPWGVDRPDWPMVGAFVTGILIVLGLLLAAYGWAVLKIFGGSCDT